MYSRYTFFPILLLYCCKACGNVDMIYEMGLQYMRRLKLELSPRRQLCTFCVLSVLVDGDTLILWHHERNKIYETRYRHCNKEHCNIMQEKTDLFVRCCGKSLQQVHEIAAKSPQSTNSPSWWCRCSCHATVRRVDNLDRAGS